MYARGQSVRVVGRDVLGVVVSIRGLVHELAVWPQSRLEATAEQLEPLSHADACPRSLVGDVELVRRAIVLGNRCMPRARDGRCHWCDRELAELHVDDESDREVTRG